MIETAFLALLIIATTMQAWLLVTSIRWRKESIRRLAQIHREHEAWERRAAGWKARVAFLRRDRGEA